MIVPPRQGGAAQSCSARAVCSRLSSVAALAVLVLGTAAFAAPPGISADRKAALITAFERATAAADFLTEAERMNLEVDPVGAAKLDALLAEAYATPKDIIAKAAKAMSD